MHSQIYTILPFILSATSVYGAPQATLNTSAPSPASITPASVISESPKPTSSSSPITCPDKNSTVPISDLLNINAKLDAAGTIGTTCCADYLPSTPDGTSDGIHTIANPFALCAASDSGTTGVYLQVTQPISLSSAPGASSQPTDELFCVPAAQVANYVIDWTSSDLNAACASSGRFGSNGGSVLGPVQDVWQVPGLTLSARVIKN